MKSGQSTYQQGESFHWDKREILMKKAKKKGAKRLPVKSSIGRNDDYVNNIDLQISISIIFKL